MGATLKQVKHVRLCPLVLLGFLKEAEAKICLNVLWELVLAGKEDAGVWGIWGLIKGKDMTQGYTSFVRQLTNLYLGNVPSSGCWSRVYDTAGLLLRRGGWPGNSQGRGGGSRTYSICVMSPKTWRGVSGSETPKSCSLLEPRNHKVLTHLWLADVRWDFVGYANQGDAKGVNICSFGLCLKQLDIYKSEFGTSLLLS